MKRKGNEMITLSAPAIVLFQKQLHTGEYIVLAKYGREYVTWKCNANDTFKGVYDPEYGHYFDNIDDAFQNYQTRH
jgi:hypothetical protein